MREYQRIDLDELKRQGEGFFYVMHMEILLKMKMITALLL